jgi:hypothetical protein
MCLDARLKRSGMTDQTGKLLKRKSQPGRAGTNKQNDFRQNYSFNRFASNRFALCFLL